MLNKAVVPLTRAVRNCHHAPAKFTGQTPTSFIHDGWANARTPFHVHNKWSFATKAIAFLAIGFWAPFIVVEYQLRKANQ
ncbi:cytochrome c oxidase subunit VIIc [Ancylostoma ceylanicum]|uniref:Cytochrome c oxidase subunit VIIc n=2 Tax=Ancylostoma TaxID=29169 RepID=A0A0D6LTM5_9BILA|nr:cytochrome c oxidase subunit VIIc [Ancylostoma ceylanicum]RCN48640.1 cytochrome c oxidase subunit VIIc [Ancylostoma caninum]